MGELSLKDKLELIAKFIGIFASIAGGLIWLQTYVKDVNQRFTDRQRETIRYHVLYNSQEILAAREVFADFRVKAFEINRKTIEALRSQQQAEEKGPALLQASIVELIRRAENKTEIPRLITFFEQLGVCIEFNMCDDKSARKLFKGEAYEIVYFLSGYIDVKRRSNPEYGSSLKALAYDTGYK